MCIRDRNYPYRSDYLWLTVPDHWLYKTGEQAKVEVSFYKYGIHLAVTGNSILIETYLHLSLFARLIEPVVRHG